mmetsp:Transcript_71152/g.224756  ORF Transcript_71152/g.224756 Transcript_71152/m.224756 type:complete len:220 (+) Transcript_71152:2-661(+)
MIFGNFPYMPKEVSSPAMKKAILSGVPEPSFGKSEKPRNSRISFQEPSTEFVKAILVRRTEARPTAEQALELPFLKPNEVKEDLPLRANIKKARKLTHELKKPVNAIQQRGLDELLQRLQEAMGRDASFMFFSEGRAGSLEPSPQSSELEEDRIVRRRKSGRHGTHSGVVSEKSIRLDPTDGDSSDVSREGNASQDTPKTGVPLVDLVPKPKHQRKTSM